MKFDLTGLLTLALMFSTSYCVKGETSGQLNWPTHSIQLSVQRTNSDAGIPTSLSIRSGTNEIAVVGDDHLVRIKDRETGKLIRVLETHSDWIKTAKFHPNAKTLITGGADRKIVVWNAENHHDFYRFTTEDRAISDLDIDPSGKLLATVGFSSQLNVYQLDNKQRLHSLECPDSDIRTVAFSRDGTLIAVGGRSGTVRVFNTATGQKVKDFPVHRRRIRDLIFDSTGNKLISCSDDRTVKCINLPSGEINQLLSAPAKFYSLALISDQKLAAGASDNLIRIIDIQQQSEIGYLEGHQGTVCCLCADGNELISGSFDTQVRVWEVEGSWVDSKARPFKSAQTGPGSKNSVLKNKVLNPGKQPEVVGNPQSPTLSLKPATTAPSNKGAFLPSGNTKATGAATSKKSDQIDSAAPGTSLAPQNGFVPSKSKTFSNVPFSKNKLPSSPASSGGGFEISK